MAAVRVPDWQIYANKNFPEMQFSNSGLLKSSTWSMGGMSGNCWDNVMTYSEANPQPNFDELDLILEKVDPDILYVEYKRIVRECVTFEDSSYSEYYGGRSNYRCYVLNFAKLYELLDLSID